MARRRKSFKRARARSFGAKRTRRRSSKGLGGMGGIVAPALYGYARGYVGNFVKTQVASRVGALGNLSDEVLMFGTNWVASRYGPAMVRPYARFGLQAEAFLLGVKLSQGGLSGLMNGGGASGVTIA